MEPLRGEKTNYSTTSSNNIPVLTIENASRQFPQQTGPEDNSSLIKKPDDFQQLQFPQQVQQNGSFYSQSPIQPKNNGSFTSSNAFILPPSFSQGFPMQQQLEAKESPNMNRLVQNILPNNNSNSASNFFGFSSKSTNNTLGFSNYMSGLSSEPYSSSSNGNFLQNANNSSYFQSVPNNNNNNNSNTELGDSFKKNISYASSPHMQMPVGDSSIANKQLYYNQYIMPSQQQQQQQQQSASMNTDVLQTPSHTTATEDSNVERSAIACDFCRSMHRKCGKELPSCKECKFREIKCVYSSPKKRGRPPKTEDYASGILSPAFSDQTGQDAAGTPTAVASSSAVDGQQNIDLAKKQKKKKEDGKKKFKSDAGDYFEVDNQQSVYIPQKIPNMDFSVDQVGQFYDIYANFVSFGKPFISKDSMQQIALECKSATNPMDTIILSKKALLFSMQAVTSQRIGNRELALNSYQICKGIIFTLGVFETLPSNVLCAVALGLLAQFLSAEDRKARESAGLYLQNAYYFLVRSSVTQIANISDIAPYLTFLRQQFHYLDFMLYLYSDNRPRFSIANKINLLRKILQNMPQKDYYSRLYEAFDKIDESNCTLCLSQLDDLISLFESVTTTTQLMILSFKILLQGLKIEYLNYLESLVPQTFSVGTSVEEALNYFDTERKRVANAIISSVVERKEWAAMGSVLMVRTISEIAKVHLRIPIPIEWIASYKNHESASASNTVTLASQLKDATLAAKYAEYVSLYKIYALESSLMEIYAAKYGIVLEKYGDVVNQLRQKLALLGPYFAHVPLSLNEITPTPVPTISPPAALTELNANIARQMQLVLQQQQMSLNNFQSLLMQYVQ